MDNRFYGTKHYLKAGYVKVHVLKRWSKHAEDTAKWFTRNTCVVRSVNLPKYAAHHVDAHQTRNHRIGKFNVTTITHVRTHLRVCIFGRRLLSLQTQLLLCQRLELQPAVNDTRMLLLNVALLRLCDSVESVQESGKYLPSVRFFTFCLLLSTK